MGTIKNLSNRFRVLDYDLIKQQALIETAPQIIPEMTEQQMRLGERSDGEIIGYLKDRYYAEGKTESGGLAPPGEVDLRLTGDFQAGLRTVVTELTLKTYSIDTKAQVLELGNRKRKGYGPLIYGANKENLSKYAIENLRPVLMEKLKTATVG
jgi:hypothetical protein